jgi:hypothetical protein
MLPSSVSIATPGQPRTLLPLRKKKRGSALLATLCFSSVLMLSLASYLAVCYRSLSLSSRNMQSARAIELAEMGMEEGLWALTNANWTGWTTSGGVATKTISGAANFENSATNLVTITVSNYTQTIANFTTTTTPTVTVTAVGTVTMADGTTVSRTLRSNAKPAQLFPNAVAASTATDATYTVSFANGVVDSYDSSVAAYTATNPAALNATNSAAVIAGRAVTLGATQVYGFAATNGTSLSYLSTAKVIGPSTSAGTNIDSARTSTTAYQPSFALVTPVGGTTLYDPNNGSATITHSIVINSSGIYRVYAFDLGSSDIVWITGANVTLVITDYINITSSAMFWISSGSTVQIYFENNTTSSNRQLSVGGNGFNYGAANPQPKNLSIIGLGSRPSGSNSRITTTDGFYGTIYFPNDNIDITSNASIYGAIVGKNVTFSNTSPAVHFDKALLKIGINGVSTPFSLVWLREI